MPSLLGRNIRGIVSWVGGHSVFSRGSTTSLSTCVGLCYSTNRVVLVETWRKCHPERELVQSEPFCNSHVTFIHCSACNCHWKVTGRQPNKTKIHSNTLWITFRRIKNGLPLIRRYCVSNLLKILTRRNLCNSPVEAMKFLASLEIIFYFILFILSFEE